MSALHTLWHVVKVCWNELGTIGNLMVLFAFWKWIKKNIQSVADVAEQKKSKIIVFWGICFFMYFVVPSFFFFFSTKSRGFGYTLLAVSCLLVVAVGMYAFWLTRKIYLVLKRIKEEEGQSKNVRK